MALWVRLGLCSAALIGASIPAQAPDAALSCLYSGSDGPTLLLASEEHSTDAHQIARETIQAVLERCAAQHQWSPTVEDQAIRYALGLRFEERAEQQLPRHGLEPAFLAQVADRLSAAQRAVVLGGETEPVVAAVIELLTARGFPLDGLSGEQAEHLGEAVGEGVTGLLMRRDAAERFGNPR